MKTNNLFEAANPLRYGNLGVGDFDGDGVDDVFLGTGATWWFSSGGKAEWRFLNRMPEYASDLRFGDFDHDGRTDVIAQHGASIDVSWAGGSRWFPLNARSGVDLVVGQFDADPRADLLATDGQQWVWSSGGTAPWAFFATSGYRGWQLRTGDFFNGDGITEIFAIDDDWKLVTGPGAGWMFLNEAHEEEIGELVVADFDGDGRADVGHQVFRPFEDLPYQWEISSGGTSPFAPLVEHSTSILVHTIGSFDDVPGADVLYWRDDLWLDIASGGSALAPWSRQSMR